jgi:hypothetical protein
VKEIIDKTGVNPQDIPLGNVKKVTHTMVDSSLAVNDPQTFLAFVKVISRSGITDKEKAYLRELYLALKSDEELGNIQLSQLRERVAHGSLPEKFDEDDKKILERMLKAGPAY